MEEEEEEEEERWRIPRGWVREGTSWMDSAS